MGKRGPKSTPTNIKKLRGNPGKRKLPENEPRPKDLNEIPDPPSWLDYYARKEWEHRAPFLIEAGLLTGADIPTFVMMCQLFARWKRASIQLMENGMVYTNANGEPKNRPEELIARKAEELYDKFCKHFGLSPATRVDISVEKDDKPTAEDIMSGRAG